MQILRHAIFYVLMLTVFAAAGQQNLQNYTPSILFKKHDWEFKTFQNIYWQTKVFAGNGLRKTESGAGRQLWATSINQFLYGISDQINIGFDFWGKYVDYEQSGLGRQRAIVGIGPKIKIAPFRQLERLSIQSTFLLPVSDDLENMDVEGMGNRYFIHEDASLWLTQFFYDKPLSDKLQLFLQQAFWYHFERNSFRSENYLKTQTSVFLSYFPTNRWTLYAMSEYFPTHYSYRGPEDQGDNAFDNYFVQSGLGVKYQAIFNKLEFELLFTDFWAGSDGQGAGQTLNLGVRLIRQ